MFPPIPFIKAHETPPNWGLGIFPGHFTDGVSPSVEHQNKQTNKRI